MIKFLTLIVILISSMSAQAKDSIISGLSSNNISINATFTGSDILLFGSIKRSNNSKIKPSNIIIEVLGPNTDLTIRKKKKILGIWINSNPIKVYNSPSFYSLIYTKKPEEVLAKSEQLEALIGKEKFYKSTKEDQPYLDAIDAKIRIKREEGSYLFDNEPITLKENTLFSTRITLPANLTEGDYKTNVYLIQDKKVVHHLSDTIKVRKIGIEKWLYNMAQEHALFYGIFSIFLALFFGWSASTLFRRFQK